MHKKHTYITIHDYLLRTDPSAATTYNKMAGEEKKEFFKKHEMEIYDFCRINELVLLEPDFGYKEIKIEPLTFDKYCIDVGLISPSELNIDLENNAIGKLSSLWSTHKKEFINFCEFMHIDYRLYE